MSVDKKHLEESNNSAPESQDFSNADLYLVYEMGMDRGTFGMYLNKFSVPQLLKLKDYLEIIMYLMNGQEIQMTIVKIQVLIAEVITRFHELLMIRIGNYETVPDNGEDELNRRIAETRVISGICNEYHMIFSHCFDFFTGGDRFEKSN